MAAKTQDRRRRRLQFRRARSHRRRASACLLHHQAAPRRRPLPTGAATPARTKGTTGEKRPPPAKARRPAQRQEDALDQTRHAPLVWRRRALYFGNRHRNGGLASPRIRAGAYSLGPRARSHRPARSASVPVRRSHDRASDVSLLVRQSVVDGYRPGMATLKTLLQTLLRERRRCRRVSAAGGARAAGSRGFPSARRASRDPRARARRRSGVLHAAAG